MATEYSNLTATAVRKFQATSPRCPDSSSLIPSRIDPGLVRAVQAVSPLFLTPGPVRESLDGPCSKRSRRTSPCQREPIGSPVGYWLRHQWNCRQPCSRVSPWACKAQSANYKAWERLACSLSEDLWGQWFKGTGPLPFSSISVSLFVFGIGRASFLANKQLQSLPNPSKAYQSIFEGITHFFVKFKG